MEKTCKNCANRRTPKCGVCVTTPSAQGSADKLPSRWEPDDQTLKADAVNHPTHYTAGGIECIDAIKSAMTGLSGFEGYCTGNAIKYLWRWKRKNGVQDLEKARWYLDRLIVEKKLEADNERS
jgi:hypothetical protein